MIRISFSMINLSLISEKLTIKNFFYHYLFYLHFIYLNLVWFLMQISQAVTSASSREEPWKPGCCREVSADCRSIRCSLRWWISVSVSN